MIKKIKDFFKEKQFLKSNTWISKYNLDGCLSLGFNMDNDKLVLFDKHHNFNIYIKNSKNSRNIKSALYVENIFIERIIAFDSLKYGEMDYIIENKLFYNTIDLFRKKYNNWFSEDIQKDDETDLEYLNRCPISELFDVYMDYELSSLFQLYRLYDIKDGIYQSRSFSADNLVFPMKIGFAVCYEIDDNYKFDRNEFDMVSDRIKNFVDDSIISEYKLANDRIQLAFYWEFNSYKEISDFLS